MSGLKDLFMSLFVDVLNLHEGIAEILLMVVEILVWLIIGVVAIKTIRTIIFRAMKVDKNSARALTIARLLSSVFKYLVWFIVALMILGVLNVDVTPFLASAGVVGLAVGFGAQEIVRDFLTGFFIIFEDSFTVGDVIEVDGFKGNVLSLGLRTTIIENWRGDRKIVNNGNIGSMINFSRNKSVGIVDFGVSYDTDLSKFSELMKDFVIAIDNKYEDIIETPQYLGVTELADSSINMRIIAKTEPMNYFHIERLIRQDLVEFCIKNNIEIPYPQLVVRNA